MNTLVKVGRWNIIPVEDWGWDIKQSGNWSHQLHTADLRDLRDALDQLLGKTTSQPQEQSATYDYSLAWLAKELEIQTKRINGLVNVERLRFSFAKPKEITEAQKDLLTRG